MYVHLIKGRVAFDGKDCVNERLGLHSSFITQLCRYQKRSKPENKQVKKNCFTGWQIQQSE